MSKAPPLVIKEYWPPKIVLEKRGPRYWRFTLKTSDLTSLFPGWYAWGLTPKHAYSRAVRKAERQQRAYVKRHGPKETLEIT